MRRHVTVIKGWLWDWSSPWSGAICSLQRPLPALRSQSAFASKIRFLRLKESFCIFKYFEQLQIFTNCNSLTELYLCCDYNITADSYMDLYGFLLTGCMAPLKHWVHVVHQWRFGCNSPHNYSIKDLCWVELIVPSRLDSDICHLLAGPVGTASEGGGLLLWEGKSH